MTSSFYQVLNVIEEDSFDVLLLDPSGAQIADDKLTEVVNFLLVLAEDVFGAHFVIGAQEEYRVEGVVDDLIHKLIEVCSA